MRIGNSLFWNALRDGEENVKPFRDGSGKIILFGFILDVTAGHVNGQYIAVNCLEGGLVMMWVKITDGFADDETQFDFLMEQNTVRA
jgi:hypothetical protein